MYRSKVGSWTAVSAMDDQHSSKHGNNYCSGLIFLQSLFSNTFISRYWFHSTNKDNNPYGNGLFSSRLFKLFLILYDFAGMGILLVFYRLAYNDHAMDSLFEGSTKKGTMDFIFRSSHLCIAIELSASKIATTFGGGRIIQIMNGIAQNTNMKNLNIVHYNLIHISGLIMPSFYCISFICYSTIFEEQYQTKLWSCIHAFSGLVYGACKCSINLIHCYTSLLIITQIKDYRNHLTKCTNYGLLFQDMLCLRKYVIEINEKLCVALMIKIILNGVILSSALCSIEDKLHSSNLQTIQVITLLSFIIGTFVDPLISCYASQKITDRMEDLADSVRELMVLNCLDRLTPLSRTSKVHSTFFQPPTTPERQSSDTEPIGHHYNNNKILQEVRQQRTISDDEQYCLEQICEMKNSFGFNVMNMFNLRNMTMLYFISNVLSNAILLIQTKE